MAAGRPSLGLVTVKVGLPQEMLDRLDAEGLGRSEWVREACEMRLSGLTPVRDVRDDPVVEVPVREALPKRVHRPGKRDWTGDFPAVEAAIREHRYSTRDLATRLGWPAMRLDRVLEAMEAAGKVRYERGMVVAA